MKQFSLNGDWEVTNAKGTHTTAARVPGCIHLDLLRARLIPDPYFRDNEDRLQWIGEEDWIYRRRFHLKADILNAANLLLRADGLDTFAEIIVNGQSIAETNNMFRYWEFDLKPAVHAGENEIAIHFKSPFPYMRSCQAGHFLFHTGLDHHRANGGNWVRKESCNFGWDWGPTLVTCGIWRPLTILAFSHPRLEDFHVLQKHGSDGSVSLHMRATVTKESSDKAMSLSWFLRHPDGQVERVDLHHGDNDEAATILIPQPQLWWPAGMGAQPLYEVEVCLCDSMGQVWDTQKKKLGLRQLTLVQENDAWGRSFFFRVNGQSFFAKGANWIPADTFDNRIEKEDLRDLLASAKAANMNCLRVWGGGIYERDDFYDLCDEMGLCLWQDFMFACSAYPAHDKDFLANVRVEAVQNVRRLRHHASIILWCGNNELEQIEGLVGEQPGAMSWHHYETLFEDILGSVVAELDPSRPYLPSSEHSPVGDRSKSGDPRWGDAHLWRVWHGREPFEWYRTSYHRFCSEFGFQSLPHPETVASYTNPGERNLTSYIMERHQRSPIGNSAIMDYLLSWFQLPVGWKNTVWLSQILQSLAIKYAVEHWRRNMPRCMGALFWQLNDCWPVASWSSIDSAHRWKALHYAARRFFAPTLLSVVETPANGTLDLYLTHDGVETHNVDIAVTAETTEGKEVYAHTVKTHLPSNGAAHVATLDVQALLSEHGSRRLLFFARLLCNGAEEHRDLVLFARPKHLELVSPLLKASILSGCRNKAVIQVSTDKPALWVWLTLRGEPETRFSDNFFHLRSGESRDIILDLSRCGRKVVDPVSIVLRDLTATFQENLES